MICLFLHFVKSKFLASKLEVGKTQFSVEQLRTPHSKKFWNIYLFYLCITFLKPIQGLFNDHIYKITKFLVKT